MSLHASTEDLLAMGREGAKVRMPPSDPPAVKPPAPPSELAQLVGEVKQLSGSLLALTKRPTPAPTVNVEAPQVSVQPEVTLQQCRKWRFTVESRDNTEEQRIKSIIVEAID